MRQVRRLAQVVAAVLLGALAACSSPNPNLYTIAPVSGATVSGAPKAIELRQIGLARFLERSQIVRSSENYRLDVMANDWWGEPLGAMLARVLVEELSQRLPQSTIYAETGAMSITPDATIELNVSRLDENTAGTLVLQAQAAVTATVQGHNVPVTRAFRFEIPPSDSGVGGEVAAISVAVGQLADGLATMLAPALSTTSPIAPRAAHPTGRRRR
jgi:uncharacterized lipoprotein YmbA